jgi:3-hydroxyacyl-CoA dehydrogenase
VSENEFCSLIDLGDGVLCAEFHSKMNTIENNLLRVVGEGVDLLNEGKFEGMVVGNQGRHFSTGANVPMILGLVKEGKWDAVADVIRLFQQTNMAMRFCLRPVVAAPHHYTLGGGLEVVQHTARVVAARETYGGLVEVGVGIIPAAGGTKEMLRRALAYVPDNVAGADPFPYVRRAFDMISTAKTTSNAAELIGLGYLMPTDVSYANEDHLIKRAKDVCRALVLAGYSPPRPASLTALGESGRAALCSAVYQLQLGGYASEHDVVIAEKLANVLTGGDRPSGSKMTEQDVLDLELEAMLSLCGTEKTQQRMQHLLDTGKLLRN